MTSRYDAILLLGFGGPGATHEIRPFLDRVLDGRSVSNERYEEVVSHYEYIGGKSPYTELTRRQAGALSSLLRERGQDIPVAVAYRHSEPGVKEVLERLARAGAGRILAIVLAPHQSPVSWGRYLQSVESARARLGSQGPHVDYAEPYFDHPLFIRAHAQRVQEALRRLGSADFAGVELVFTAHSIPTQIAAASPYVQQYIRSATLVAKAAGARHWSLAYQSRSGSPGEPWLEPDVRDTLKRLGARGVQKAIVSPVGFLCDHVEVLYDLDIAGAQAARSVGLRIERATALNDHPRFIELLAELACTRITQPQAARA